MFEDNIMKKNRILKVVLFSVFATWLIAILTKFGMVIPRKNYHYELLGVFMPLVSFIIPILNKDNMESKEIYWSKENIIAQIITIIINLIPIMIINYNYNQC